MGVYVRNGGKPTRVDKRFSEIPSKYMGGAKQGNLLEEPNEKRTSVSPSKKIANGRPYITKTKYMV